MRVELERGLELSSGRGEGLAIVAPAQVHPRIRQQREPLGEALRALRCTIGHPMIEGNPIRIRNAIATVTLLVLLSGCAGEMVTVRRIDPSLGLESSPWIDHTRVELETAWGAPQGVQPDGEGGSILEYKRDRAFQVDTGDDPTTPEDDSVLLQEDVNRKTVARFWIDASDRIYRVWIDSRLWEKGYPMPGDTREP